VVDIGSTAVMLVMSSEVETSLDVYATVAAVEYNLEIPRLRSE
jgi:hypothetical protein